MRDTYVRLLITKSTALRQTSSTFAYCAQVAESTSVWRHVFQFVIAYLGPMFLCACRRTEVFGLSLFTNLRMWRTSHLFLIDKQLALRRRCQDFWGRIDMVRKWETGVATRLSAFEFFPGLSRRHSPIRDCTNLAEVTHNKDKQQPMAYSGGYLKATWHEGREMQL